MKEIVKERVRKRQATSAPGVYGGKPLVDPGTLSGSNKKGKSRDKLAEEVGFKGKGRTLERGIQIYKAAKEGKHMDRQHQENRLWTLGP